MSKPAPVLPPASPADPAAYRPLSVLAIAALALAVVYALIISGLGIVALIRREPLFAGVWTYVIALPAVLLALIALMRIRTSEGTLAGAALARAALWTAIIPALAYGAFSVGTFFAVVRVQSERFARTWFEDLRTGKAKDAFLMTRRAADRRAGNDPNEFFNRFVVGNDGLNGAFPRFEQHDLIRAIREGGTETQVEPLGIEDWRYRDNVYDVTQRFRVHTPEGTFEFSLSLQGTRDKTGRQWTIVWTDAQNVTYTSPPVLTDLGRGILWFQHNAESFATEWLERQRHGDVVPMYLATKTPKERLALAGPYYARMVAVALSRTSAAPMIATSALLLADRKATMYLIGAGSDFAAFQQGQIVVWDKESFQGVDAVKVSVPQIVRTYFDQPARVGMMLPKGAQGRPQLVSGSDQRIQMDFNVEVGIREPAADGALAPKYRSVAQLELESDGVPIDVRHTPQWRVVALRLLSAGEPSPRAGRHTMIVPPDLMPPPILPNEP